MSNILIIDDEYILLGLTKALRVLAKGSSIATARHAGRRSTFSSPGPWTLS